MLLPLVLILLQEQITLLSALAVKDLIMEPLQLLDALMLMVLPRAL